MTTVLETLPEGRGMQSETIVIYENSIFFHISDGKLSEMEIHRYDVSLCTVFSVLVSSPQPWAPRTRLECFWALRSEVHLSAGPAGV